MRKLKGKSVDLVVIDPPYNIGKDKRWDRFDKDEYIAFMIEVFVECDRVLKDTGSFYWFHNDMPQVRRLMDEVDNETTFVFKQFIIWNKRYKESPRKYYFDNVVKTKIDRNFRQMAEYCLFYTKQDDLNEILHDVSRFRGLRQYFSDLLDSFGITKAEVMRKVGQRADHCFRSNSTQWDLPTEETYFDLLKLKREPSFNARSYDSIIREYEDKRGEYDKLRYTYNNQRSHHSVWDYEVAPKLGHVTPKPVDLVENIVRHSSNEGDVILDCFLGSGTTAVAAVNTGRNFIGIEREQEYVDISKRRIAEAQANLDTE